MKILFIAQYFPPEIGALAARASELAHHWVTLGHHATVLTGFPNYPSGIIPIEYRYKIRRLVYREKVDGYDVLRTWLTTFSNRTSLRRILAYLSFLISASLSGTFFLGRPNVLIASSPPLTTGLIGWWLSKVKRVPFILEIRDLWPDSIIASGVSTKSSILIRTLRKLSEFLYKRSDHIVVVTPAFKQEICSNWEISPSKVSIIMNRVETEIFSPNGDGEAIKRELGFSGKYIIAYIGNFGWAQGLETIIEAAGLISSQIPNAIFLLIGDGADRTRLISLADRKGLVNLKILPPQPREKIPEIILASDACLVPLRDAPVFRTTIPSKIFEIMACGRPIILGVDGQARKIIEETEAGIFVQPESAQAIASGINQLFSNPELAKRLGDNGRIHALKSFSRKSTAQEYIKLLSRLTNYV